MKPYLLTVLFTLISYLSFAHSVQVAWCGSCNGELTLWVEHWHGTASPTSTTMTIQVTINGVTTTATGSPDINIPSTIGNLPNCATPPNVISSCSEANSENDWVRYTFPQVPCGVPVSITVISGNSVFTADCGGMYPATTGTITIPCPAPPFQLPDQEVCANDNMSGVTFLNSTQPGVTYEWENNNPNIGLADDGIGDIPPFATPPSTQTEVATIDVVQGCNSAQFTITVHPQPIPSFVVTNSTNLNPTGAPITTCLYDPIYFQDQTNVTAGNIADLLWDFGDGSPNSSSGTPAHIYPTHGTYTVSLNTTTNNGCTANTTSQVIVDPVPEAHLLESPVCLTEGVQFEDSSFVAFPSYISNTYLDFGDGSPISTLINPLHVYANPGVYNIHYNVVTNKGCLDSTDITTEVYVLPVADYTNTEVCENFDITEFTDASTIPSGSIDEWQWNFDDPVDGIATLPNPSHNYSADGLYSVEMIVKSDHGCLDSITKNVLVLAKPIAIFSSDITEACSEACINFQDYSLSNATAITYWEWDLDGGDLSNNQNPFKCYSNISNTDDSLFSVGLITGNDLGCYDTIFIADYIAAWHNPVASFYPDPYLTHMHLPTIDFNNTSIGADFYNYDFGDEAYSLDFEPSHYYMDTGNYEIQLIVETVHGCMDTTYDEIRIDPYISIFVPNTFTPDGDGINDEFIFKEFGMLEETVTFQIFDRWGLLIFEGYNFTPWDGTHLGVKAQQDTYIYQIKIQDFFGDWHDLQGHVNLLR